MQSLHHALPSVAELIEAALPRARWFAGKGRTARVRALVALPWLDEAGPPAGLDEAAPAAGSQQAAGLPAIRLEIAEVVYPDDPDHVDHYLVPLCYRAAADPAGPGLGVAAHPTLGPVAVHDATADAYAGDVLLRLVSTAQELTDGTTRLQSQVLETGRLRPGLPARRFGGEQSNTSIMYADVAMLKFFRRLEWGENLDIEVHRELAAGPAAERLATLFGWLSAEWVDFTGQSRRADLGMLVEQVPGAADGWDLAVSSVRDGTDFTAAAAELGQALRDVHTGLAAAFGTATAPGSEQANTMRRRLVAALSDVDELSLLHGALDSRLARLGDLEQPIQRIHGDFHLGQVLHARGASTPGWRIIDFEGEPLKSLAERRTFDTVWRDVAGMLRSFDYAGAYATRELGADVQRAKAWVAECRAEFLAAYARRQLTPEEAQILQAYEIDKAVYECRYEKRNRPVWLPIPLGALAALTTTEVNAFEGGNHGS